MEKSVSLFDTVRRIGEHPPQAFSQGEAVLHGQMLQILHLMSEGPWRFLSEGGVGQLGMTSRTHVVSRLCKQGPGNSYMYIQRISHQEKLNKYIIDN